jgi:hypothetical protein
VFSLLQGRLTTVLQEEICVEREVDWWPDGAARSVISSVLLSWVSWSKPDD